MRYAGLCLLVGAMLTPLPAVAEVVTDGTLGARQRVKVPGPDYRIGASLGEIRGRNLFHSFDRFGIETKRSATFTGPSGLDNVISRVTGGEPTSIDGRLTSKVPNADFWFLNPAGVAFGPNARLDVPGSFHVSTADELRFPDGGVFSAVEPTKTVLSVAAPESFGFLGDGAGAITTVSSLLEVNPGASFSAVAGAVDVSDSFLIAPSGSVSLTAQSSQGEVAARKSAEPGTADGKIRVSVSTISTSGDGGGKVFIRGGTILTDLSILEAGTNGANDAGLVQMEAQGPLTIAHSIVGAGSFATGEAGGVRLVGAPLKLDGAQVDSSAIGPSTAAAGRVTLESNGLVDIGGALLPNQNDFDQDPAGRFAGIFVNSANPAAGGRVSITADRFTLTDGALITASGRPSTFGRSGSVMIAADKQFIGGPSIIEASSNSPLPGGGIKLAGKEITLDGAGSAEGARVFTSTFYFGNAGFLELDAASIMLQGKSVARSATFGPGDAGVVRVSAGDLVLDARGTPPSSIGSDTFDQATGDGGLVDIVADSVTLIDGGAIGSTTFSQGNGGTVRLDADRLSIRGDGSSTVITATSQPGSTGAAGTIEVRADDIEIIGPGAAISSGTFNDEPAGSIRIEADRLKIDGDPAGITAFATDPSAFFGGFPTFPKGDAGDIVVKAQDIVIHGGVISSVARGFTMGDSGSVSVVSERIRLSEGAQINSDVFGYGQGGDVGVIATDHIFISGKDATGAPSGVSAGTWGAQDFVDYLSRGFPPSVQPGGSVTVTAGDIRLEHGAEISTDSFSFGDAGRIAVLSHGDIVLDEGSISTFARFAGGGQINVSVDENLVLRDRSSVTSAVAGGPGTNAGNITIGVGQLAVEDGSDILAQANEGAGGFIDINAAPIIVSSEDAIDASAGPAGIDGTVVTSTPVVDLSGQLVELPAAYLGARDRLREACGVRGDEGRGSFREAAGAALPPQPGDPLPVAPGKRKTQAHKEPTPEPKPAPGQQLVAFADCPARP